jgi:hypothetical protein
MAGVSTDRKTCRWPRDRLGPLSRQGQTGSPRDFHSGVKDKTAGIGGFLIFAIEAKGVISKAATIGGLSLC